MKTEKDFNGYWLKNIKTHKGHEGEPLIQASVYKNGKRVGFYSDGDWGGCPNLMEFSKSDEKDFTDFCKTVSDYKFEPESDVIYQILAIIDHHKWIKRQSKTKTLFTVKGDEEGSYRTLKWTWKENSDKICDYLNGKYADTYCLILPQGVSRVPSRI